MFALSSESFADGQEMPQRHGKRVQNVSPELSWADPPEGTRSFALSVVDWHPVARGYVHWLVVDLPSDTRQLEEGAHDAGLPGGAREVSPYEGPFPPGGTHDYDFVLYALDTEHVDVRGRGDLKHFLAAVEPHTLGTAKLVGKFTKQG